MAAEQSQPDKERSPADSQHIPGRSPPSPSTYEALHRRLRDPILKIEDLEARIDALKRRIQASGADEGYSKEPIHDQQWPSPAELLTRIEELEKQLANALEDHTQLESMNDAAAPSEDHNLLHQRNPEMDQLRFHISNLASQLARTDEQLKELQRARVRRRSRSRHHRRWRLWRRWVRFWRYQARALLR